MATTATVNPRRRRKKKRKSRRRNPASYGAAAKTAPRRRRAAAATPYRSAGYRKRVANPKLRLMDMDRYVKIIPPAAIGNSIGRAAVKLAGPFDNGEPGIKHAIAGVLGIALGSNLVGNVFRDTRAAEYAYASGLGYLGELFLRKRFLKDSAWYTENISLEGDAVDQYMDGSPAHDLGACGAPGDVVALPGGEVVQVLSGPGQQSFRTGDGKQYVQTATGWQMAGITNSPSAARMEMPVPSLPGGAMNGFQNNSQLSGYGASSSTSFGYAPR